MQLDGVHCETRAHFGAVCATQQGHATVADLVAQIERLLIELLLQLLPPGPFEMYVFTCSAAADSAVANLDP